MLITYMRSITYGHFPIKLVTTLAIPNYQSYSTTVQLFILKQFLENYISSAKLTAHLADILLISRQQPYISTIKR